MKLLIVDDSAMIRRAVSTAYKGSIFTDVQTAADGLLALTVFKRQLPDVVTLDITMPHMDGLAALSQMLIIKPNTVVLVISALADHHTAIESLMRGAQQFICKPFSTEDLKEALDQIISETDKESFKKSKGAELANNDLSNNLSSVKLEQVIEKTKHIQTISTPQVPTRKLYPSGYVKPPEINTTPLPSQNPQQKANAVSRQAPMKQELMRNNISKKMA